MSFAASQRTDPTEDPSLLLGEALHLATLGPKSVLVLQLSSNYSPTPILFQMFKKKSCILLLLSAV